MRHFKTLILGFAVSLAFAACGEGFKANHTLNDSAADITPPAPASETPAEVDEAIVRDFGVDPLNIDESNKLSDEIGAFEIVTEIVSHPGGASDNLRVIRASFMSESCNSPVIEIENTTVTLEQMRSRRQITVGTSEQYEVKVSCTTTSCREMTAMLVRYRSNQEESLAAYGLVETKNDFENNISRRTYTSRRSESQSSFFSTVLSLEDKFNSCMQGPVRPEIVDPTGAELDGDFIELPTPDENNSFFFPTTTAI